MLCHICSKQAVNTDPKLGLCDDHLISELQEFGSGVQFQYVEEPHHNRQRTAYSRNDKRPDRRGEYASAAQENAINDWEDASAIVDEPV